MKYMDKEISRLVFGTDRLGETRKKESFQILDDAYSLGIRAFDTAAVYMDNAEGVLYEWIAARGVRTEVVVLTKGAHPNPWRSRVTPWDIRADVCDSLAKAEISYLDIFMLHRDDPSVPVGTIMETLNRLADEGKIKSFGASNWSLRRFQEANAYAERFHMMGFSCVQPHFSLAEQMGNPWVGACETLTGEKNRAAREYYGEQKIPVFAYSSMGRGFFSGRFHAGEWEKARELLDEAAVRGYLYEENMERLRRAEELAAQMDVTVSQIALAWVFRQGLNVYALVSAASRKHMEENLRALELELSPEQCRWLNLED